MTNWMTATGIALIAGGLATLICFRRLLWSGRRSVPGPAVVPAQPGVPEISGAHPTAAAAPEASIGLADESPTGSDGEEGERPAEAHPAADDVDADEVWSDVDSDPPTGDYWMPVPESAYADLDSAGCGWPARTGRDPAVECEPTAVVPTWPPARPFDRIELPRTWSEGSGRRTLRAAEPRRRPRPRPNPSVYVSRHAAE